MQPPASGARGAVATTLLLIRHGETAWNAQGRIQGQLDVPLSARGVWQAARLADSLAGEPVDAVFASDLARAALTAQPLAAVLGLPLQLDARLRERDFGRFQGHTPEEVAARWPAQFQRWRSRDPAWAIPEGESGDRFIARVLEALRELAGAHRGRRLAVVAHGGTLDVIYRHARGLSWDAPREHAMLNASVNRVCAWSEAGGELRWSVESWGDVEHLADGARDEFAGV